MKTKHLDEEIELLNSIKRNHEISDYGQEKLNEFIAIKKQLLLHNVSQHRELLKDFLEHIENTIDYVRFEPNELIDDYFNSL